jgi:predicted homoserine dehydrogenase-like protein
MPLQVTKVGIAGTGGVARMLVEAISRQAPSKYSRLIVGDIYAQEKSVLYRRQLSPTTTNIDTFIRDNDILVECSGRIDQPWNILHAMDAHPESHRLTTMHCINAEFMETVGWCMPTRCQPVELPGDQPSSLVNMLDTVPDVHLAATVNFKRFYDYNANIHNAGLIEFAWRFNQSVDAVVRMTDGTKLMTELCLTARLLGGTPQPEYIHRGSIAHDPYDVLRLMPHVLALYATGPGPQHLGVLTSFRQSGIGLIIRAKDSDTLRWMNYMKLTAADDNDTGPYGLLYQNYHLGPYAAVNHLVSGTGRVCSITGRRQTNTVLARAKCQIRAGEKYSVSNTRGYIGPNEDGLPYSLALGGVATHDIDQGQSIGPDLVQPASETTRTIADHWRKNI